MTPRSVLTAASALLLLSSTTATTFAAPGPVMRGGPAEPAFFDPSTGVSAGTAAMAHRYVALLNSTMQTGNVAPTVTLFARNATLTESAYVTPIGQLASTETVHGLPAIRAFLRAESRITPRLRWILDTMTPVSGSALIGYAHTASPPAQMSSLASVQRFEIRDGAIVRLETTTFYGR